MESARRWRRSVSAVVAVVAGAVATEKVVEVRLYLANDTRYLVQLLLQALSGHVGAGRAFSHYRSRPRFGPAFLFWHAGILRTRCGDVA